LSLSSECSGVPLLLSNKCLCYCASKGNTDLTERRTKQTMDLYHQIFLKIVEWKNCTTKFLILSTIKIKEFPDFVFENRSRFLVGRTSSVLSLGIRMSVSILCTVCLSLLNGVPMSLSIRVSLSISRTVSLSLSNWVLMSLSNRVSVSISCTVSLFLSNGMSLSRAYVSINLSVCVYNIYCVSISIEWNVSIKIMSLHQYECLCLYHVLCLCLCLYHVHMSLSIRVSLSISYRVSLSLSNGVPMSLSSAYVPIKWSADIRIK